MLSAGEVPSVVRLCFDGQCYDYARQASAPVASAAPQPPTIEESELLMKNLKLNINIADFRRRLWLDIRQKEIAFKR